MLYGGKQVKYYGILLLASSFEHSLHKTYDDSAIVLLVQIDAQTINPCPKISVLK